VLILLLLLLLEAVRLPLQELLTVTKTKRRIMIWTTTLSMI